MTAPSPSAEIYPHVSDWSCRSLFAPRTGSKVPAPELPFVPGVDEMIDPHWDKDLARYRVPESWGGRWYPRKEGELAGDEGDAPGGAGRTRAESGVGSSEKGASADHGESSQRFPLPAALACPVLHRAQIHRFGFFKEITDVSTHPLCPSILSQLDRMPYPPLSWTVSVSAARRQLERHKLEALEGYLPPLIAEGVIPCDSCAQSRSSACIHLSTGAPAVVPDTKPPESGFALRCYECVLQNRKCRYTYDASSRSGRPSNPAATGKEAPRGDTPYSPMPASAELYAIARLPDSAQLRAALPPLPGLSGNKSSASGTAHAGQSRPPPPLPLPRTTDWTDVPLYDVVSWAGKTRRPKRSTVDPGGLSGEARSTTGVAPRPVRDALSEGTRREQVNTEQTEGVRLTPGAEENKDDEGKEDGAGSKLSSINNSSTSTSPPPPSLARLSAFSSKKWHWSRIEVPLPRDGAAFDLDIMGDMVDLPDFGHVAVFKQALVALLPANAAANLQDHGGSNDDGVSSKKGDGDEPLRLIIFGQQTHVPAASLLVQPTASLDQPSSHAPDETTEWALSSSGFNIKECKRISALSEPPDQSPTEYADSLLKIISKLNRPPRDSPLVDAADVPAASVQSGRFGDLDRYTYAIAALAEAGTSVDPISDQFDIAWSIFAPYFDRFVSSHAKLLNTIYDLDVPLAFAIDEHRAASKAAELAPVDYIRRVWDFVLTDDTEESDNRGDHTPAGPFRSSEPTTNPTAVPMITGTAPLDASDSFYVDPTFAVLVLSRLQEFVQYCHPNGLKRLAAVQGTDIGSSMGAALSARPASAPNTKSHHARGAAESLDSRPAKRPRTSDRQSGTTELFICPEPIAYDTGTTVFHWLKRPTWDLNARACQPDDSGMMRSVTVLGVLCDVPVPVSAFSPESSSEFDHHAPTASHPSRRVREPPDQRAYVAFSLHSRPTSTRLIVYDPFSEPLKRQARYGEVIFNHLLHRAPGLFQKASAVVTVETDLLLDLDPADSGPAALGIVQLLATGDRSGTRRYLQLGLDPRAVDLLGGRGAAVPTRDTIILLRREQYRLANLLASHEDLLLVCQWARHVRDEMQNGGMAE